MKSWNIISEQERESLAGSPMSYLCRDFSSMVPYFRRHHALGYGSKSLDFAEERFSSLEAFLTSCKNWSPEQRSSILDTELSVCLFQFLLWNSCIGLLAEDLLHFHRFPQNVIFRNQHIPWSKLWRVMWHSYIDLLN